MGIEDLSLAVREGEIYGFLGSNGDRGYLLKKFDLSEEDLKRKLKEYSSGMARKIALVQTFQHCLVDLT